MRATASLTVCIALALACASPWPELPFAKPLWEQPPPPPKDDDVVPAEHVHRAELPNGVRVLLLEDHRMPAFSLGVVVARGAGVETLAEAGVADYTAELMERGAGARTALELAGVVDALGASLDVSADWDSIGVQVAGLAEDLAALEGVLADVVLRPRFDRDEAERVRAEKLAALRQAADDPTTLLSWSFSKTLYPGHRYGLPEGGTPDTVGRFGAKDARAFHRRVFVPGAAIVYASGDFEPAALLQRIRATYGAWQGPPPVDVGPPPPDPERRRVVIVDRPDLGQAQIGIGHGGIARTDPRRLPVQLLNSALGGGGFSSRLMNRIRAEAGLTYGVSSQFVQRHRQGPFAVFTFTRVPKTGEVVKLVLDELERVKRAPPSKEELARVQSQRAGQFALALETSSDVAAALVELDVYGLPRDTLDTYRGRVRAVTPAEVSAVARELIHAERASIVAVGPAELLRPQLEPFGPVEVSKPAF
jgi:zinc protease